MKLEDLRKRLVYNPNNGLLTWKEAPKFHPRLLGEEAGSVRGDYRVIKLYGKARFAHRIAWWLHYGKYPELSIDHINGNGLDNRICNLREVTHAENMRNTKRCKLNTSGRTGVSKTKDGYVAYASKDKQRIHLGSFSTIEEATAARMAADKILEFHENHGR